MGSISDELATLAESLAVDDVVEVQVELCALPAPTKLPNKSSRAERIKVASTAFADAAAPVIAAIRGAGGEVVDRSWLSQTIKARLPKGTIKAISQLEPVLRIDTNRRLKAD